MKEFVFRGLRICMIALYLLALIVPTWQRFAPFYQETPLIGIRKISKEFPKFSFERWWSGHFALDTDKWIRDHHGFSTDLVRYHRWFLYKLTGQVVHSPANKTDTLVGKNGFLYESLYVVDAIRKPGMPQSEIDKFADCLKSVDDVLKKRNAVFAVILAPNKALICPENLPSWARHLSKFENSDYFLFQKALANRGICYFDSNKFFKDNWSSYTQLQAPHSAHWSYYGAWMVLTNTIPLINSQKVLDVKLPLPCLKKNILTEAGGMDDELRPQLNLPRNCQEFSKRLITEYPIAETNLDPDFIEYKQSRQKKFKALVIGDSYGFGFCDAIMRQPLFDELIYWYYCRTTYLVNGHQSYNGENWTYANFVNKGILKRNVAYDTYCKDADVVFLVLTTFNIDKRGWDFFKHIIPQK